MILSYIDILVLKTLILELNMKCLPIWNGYELFDTLALKTWILQLSMTCLTIQNVCEVYKDIGS